MRGCPLREQPGGAGGVRTVRIRRKSEQEIQQAEKASKMQYEGNPKHKEPWQRGRRGSLCPKDIDLKRAQTLLDQSEAFGRKRFAAFEGSAYCAMEHREGRWHGYPVGWSEVPPAVRSLMIEKGKVTRREIKQNSG
jgi:hypothetical protein